MIPMAGLSSIVNRYHLLKQIPIFSSLGWYNLQKIARRARIVEYKKGENICKEGDPPDAFYCLISGRVQGYRMSASGRKSDVEFIQRGMYFGIISLLTGENHSSTFAAINDSMVIKIEKDHFLPLLKDIPQLGVALSHILSQRLRSKTVQQKIGAESKIISIYSPHKGSGSSTYAMNLALSLECEAHRKVILVCIDSIQTQPAVPSAIDATTPQWKCPGVNLREIVEDHQKITKGIIKGQMGIDLLHVSFDPSDPTIVDWISQFVTALAYDYHFVVVDLPNEKNDLVMKTLTQSDLLHLLSLEKKDDLRMVRAVITELAEHLKENFNPDKIQVIVGENSDGAMVSSQDINQEIDFTVYERLPRIEKAELTVTIDCAAMTALRPYDKSEYTRKITKIARHISGVSVGLVLGGGAALGIAHIGVLRVLEQEKIPVDIVAGSSMGALLGALWAIGKNADELETLAHEFDKAKGMLKLFDPVFPLSGLMGGRMIERWLRNHGLAGKTFYDTRTPIKIVAYDLMHREEIVIDSGLLVDAVRQSIAIPGVIEPVRDKSKTKIIIDGGVLNPLPTNVLTQCGVKKIIAVNVLQSPEDVAKDYQKEQQQLNRDDKITFWKSPLQSAGILFKKLGTRFFTPNIPDIIVRSLQASEYLLSEQSARHADVVIHPDLSGINWFELYKVNDLIKRGEEAARAALPQIKQLVSE